MFERMSKREQKPLRGGKHAGVMDACRSFQDYLTPQSLVVQPITVLSTRFGRSIVMVFVCTSR